MREGVRGTPRRPCSPRLIGPQRWVDISSLNQARHVFATILKQSLTLLRLLHLSQAKQRPLQDAKALHCHLDGAGSGMSDFR